MSNPFYVIAAVQLNSQASAIITRAATLAADAGADLAVVHVVDYQPGFEGDQVPILTPTAVRNQLVEHARASLIGLLHCLDLPVARVEVLVLVGPVGGTLLDLAEALRARTLVIGRSRWGIMATMAGFRGRLGRRGGAALEVVTDSDETGSFGGLRRWLGGDGGLRTLP